MDFYIERHHLRTEFGTHVFYVPGEVAVKILVCVAFEVDVPAFVVVEVRFEMEPLVVALQVDYRVACHEGPELSNPRLQVEVVLRLLRLGV